MLDRPERTEVPEQPSIRAWILRHPRMALAIVAIMVGVVVVGVVGGLTMRSVGRIELMNQRLEDTGRIQAVRIRLQRSLLNEVRGSIPGNSFIVEDLRLQVEQALALGQYLDPRTSDRLQQLSTILNRAPLVPQQALVAALDLLEVIHDAETGAQSALLADLQRDARRELNLTIGALVALVGIAVIGVTLFQSRLVKPLGELRVLLSQLGDGEFETIPVGTVDPLLVPVFRNYNFLVSRLEQLEVEHRSRAESLEAEVRAATRALLDQHRTVANAERLAAVGETAAGVAHELRNPLAGVLMALGNLRQEAEGADRRRRFDLVIAEVERMTRLLNDYLSAAKHSPEPAQQTDVHELVGDLLTLLQYQTPSDIRLSSEVSDSLQCRLPRDTFRQILLNLIINAVQAIGANPGSVVVTAQPVEKSLTVSVCDDGPGFPTGMVSDPSLRSFTTNREAGTGIGLAMVRRAVRDMGGDIRIENRQTGGACVSLDIPIHHA